MFKRQHELPILLHAGQTRPRLQQVDNPIDHAERELGGFDVIVNNAGIAQVKPLSEVRAEDLERIFRINVDGVVCQSALNGDLRSARKRDPSCKAFRRGS